MFLQYFLKSIFIFNFKKLISNSTPSETTTPSPAMAAFLQEYVNSWLSANLPGFLNNAVSQILAGKVTNVPGATTTTTASNTFAPLPTQTTTPATFAPLPPGSLGLRCYTCNERLQGKSICLGYTYMYNTCKLSRFLLGCRAPVSSNMPTEKCGGYCVKYINANDGNSTY